KCRLFRGPLLISQVIGADTNAVEFLDGNEVDHARYRVRAVQGGATIQDHFHSGNGDVRDQGGNRSIDGSHTIHQGQGAVLTQATRVERSPCGTLAAVGARIDVGNGVGVLGIGQITNVLAHVRRAGLVQVFLADGING